MKKMFIAVLLSVITVSAFAQDFVTKKNGEDIRAKVLEVTANEVKYKLYDEPDGPSYTVKKSDLLMIRYQSGRNEVFNQQSSSASELFYSDREPVEGLRPNMKYKELKHLYDYKEYTSDMADRYSPVWTGVASVFIPGLGECINGEWGRGLGKFFGNVALLTAGSIASLEFAYTGLIGYGVSSLVFCSAALGIEIWSIVDAVRIAKVKNMYEQDMKKGYAVKVDLYPSINYIQMGNSLQPAAGFTFALNF